MSNNQTMMNGGERVCGICKEEYIGEGHNMNGYKNKTGRCCTPCNRNVIVYRLVRRVYNHISESDPVLNSRGGMRYIPYENNPAEAGFISMWRDYYKKEVLCELKHNYILKSGWGE